MEYLLVCLVACLGSTLTLFSGFGLGTILLPAFGLFFPIELAIAMTAIVHFLNNIFKLILLGHHADRATVLRFGIPSLLASFAGAYLLLSLARSEPLYIYSIQHKIFYVTTLKLTIAAVLAFFAIYDLVPRLAAYKFPAKYMVAGGLLSGFFGGLSGNQGALRSAFLIRTNLSKEAFIASGVVIACLVDMSRLLVYSPQILSGVEGFRIGLVTAAALSAFVGAFVGSRLMKKITIRFVQQIVGAMLIVFALLLGAGIV
jgi:uncharacterized membrane protein YfcA